MPDDRSFRRDFFAQVQPAPLDPDDPRYVRLYDDGCDVIAHIRETIEFSGRESTQLLSGYRGAGKSTELRRLARDLRAQGYLVALIDIEDYLDLHSPLDVSDFILGLCGAIGEALQAPEMLGSDPIAEGIWRRMTHWIQATEVVPTEILPKLRTGTGDSRAELALKLELRGNPSFRQQLQKALAASVARIVDDARNFIAECVQALRKKHSDAARLVVLVDSIEHARGTNSTEQAVHDALERLFSQQDDKLQLPGVHTVYTVPPWLRIRRPNIGALYSGSGLYTLPAQKVRRRSEGDAPGPFHPPGIERLIELVTRRGDWNRLLGERATLERLILESGGHLRDLVRLLQTIAIEARTIPADRATVDRAISRLREQFLPIATNDARWLAEIARSRNAELKDLSLMGTLARYFDSHLVLSYLNGEAWYDVHPLVRAHILAQAGPAPIAPAATPAPADAT
ncbi:MAG: hypothetical protein H6703_13140 [Myxococcales bacterium]|nr:hypothetical protein [Myxococcales bacterium]MCB9553681.1 hypothetical protein [Myxococcales bacterium]